jgi:acetyl esterase/lipase
VLAQQAKIKKLKKPNNIILISPALSFVETREAVKYFNNEIIFTEAFFYTLKD